MIGGLTSALCGDEFPGCWPPCLHELQAARARMNGDVK